MIAQQVAGKAARDTLFLSSFHPSQLPYAMAGGAMLSLAAVYWLSWLMSRRSPASIVPFLFGASAIAFALEWGLDRRSPHAAAVLVYLHTALLGPVTISTFWSLINERFDPHTAKRAVARIAGGGTLGGVLGGLASWRASTLVQPGTLLLFLALVNGLAVVGALLIPSREAPSSGRTPSAHAVEASALTALRSSAFLRNLAILVALGAATSALLDYTFSVQAVAHFGKGQALLSFFSLFWLAVGVLSFLLQLSLGRLALEKLGLAVNIAVLPGIIILGGAIGLAVPGLNSCALLRGSEAVQRNTLFRSAYELLYTPLPEAQKRVAKAVIDIGFDRIGTIIGSGIALLALYLFKEHPASVLLGVVVVLGFSTLPVTRQLHLGYVAALRQGLRDGAEKLAGPADFDALPDSMRASISPAREQLIERLEHLRPGGLTALITPEASDEQKGAPEPADIAAEGLKAPERVLDLARELLSKDLGLARAALTRLGPRDAGVPCAILLLAHPKLHRDANQALTRIAPGSAGQLIDALLDPAMDFVVRRRIPRILRSCPTQRSAEGLLLGVTDGRFEVRYECARALLKLTGENSPVVIPQEKAIAAIEFEVRSAQRILGEAAVPAAVPAAAPAAAPADEDPNDDEQEDLIDGLKRDRKNRSLEHVFTLLCLHLEREPLRIAYSALHQADPKHRGTALEYLSTVLPTEIRDLVWPYLGEAAPLQTARSAQELLTDLALAVPPS